MIFSNECHPPLRTQREFFSFSPFRCLLRHCLESKQLKRCKLCHDLYLTDTAIAVEQIKLRITQSNCDLNGEKVRAINSTECHAGTACEFIKFRRKLAHICKLPLPSCPAIALLPSSRFPREWSDYLLDNAAIRIEY